MTTSTCRDDLRWPPSNRNGGRDHVGTLAAIKSEWWPRSDWNWWPRSSESAPIKIVRYGFRSFDRQWIIADARLINDPRPELWYRHSAQQVYFTALARSSPSHGPAFSITAEIPDYDHFKGSFGGRVFPLWNDTAATESNIHPALVAAMGAVYGYAPEAEEIYAYIAGVAAHPAYMVRFASDLQTPGLRIPVTADKNLFARAVALGKEVIWLHTFGDRFSSDDDKGGRPSKAPRLPKADMPTVPAKGVISSLVEDMPEEPIYNPATERLHVGTGYIEKVSKAVWAYQVSGKSVLEHWFSYRRLDRTRPVIGIKREPSPLGKLQPDGWLAEYTAELLSVINVLGRLVLIEAKQAAVLKEICDGATISSADIVAAQKAMPVATKRKKSVVTRNPKQGELL